MNTGEFLNVLESSKVENILWTSNSLDLSRKMNSIFNVDKVKSTLKGDLAQKNLQSYLFYFGHRLESAVLEGSTVVCTLKD